MYPACVPETVTPPWSQPRHTHTNIPLSLPQGHFHVQTTGDRKGCDLSLIFCHFRDALRHALVLRRFTFPFSNTRMRDEWIWSLGGKIVTGETEELKQNRVPGCPIQVPYGRSGNWTEVLILRSRQPNAAATAPPIVGWVRSVWISDERKILWHRNLFTSLTGV